MVTFLHVADIHLDSPLQGLENYGEAPVEEIRGATRRAFVRLIDTAIEEEVHFLIIAGDLYDGDWKDYNTGLFFIAQMGRLLRAGIRVFGVSGNHDAESRISKNLTLPENVHFFSSRHPESVRLDELGVVLHGQSYGKRDLRDNLASQYPLAESGLINIGILHTSLTGHEGHEPYAPCSVDDLLSRGYDYWALGHVHKRLEVSIDPPIIYPGNLQGRHIRETGAKGATLVTIDGEHNLRAEHCSLDVLRWSLCTVDLHACESDEEVRDTVRSVLEDEKARNACELMCTRLVLTGETPAHTGLVERSMQWIEELRGICLALGDIWLEKVFFATSSPADLPGEPEEDSPVGAILASVRSLIGTDLNSLGDIAELCSLRSKLPVELLDAEKTLLTVGEGRGEELSDRVRELLVAGLLRHGGGA